MVKIKILHFKQHIQVNLLTFFTFSINSQNKGYYSSIYSQIKHYILNKIEIFKYFYLINSYYKNYNELNVIKSIRKFCDQNNFEFIVKPRLKFPYINKINKYADK